MVHLHVSFWVPRCKTFILGELSCELAAGRQRADFMRPREAPAPTPCSLASTPTSSPPNPCGLCPQPSRRTSFPTGGHHLPPLPSSSRPSALPGRCQLSRPKHWSLSCFFEGYLESSDSTAFFGVDFPPDIFGFAWEVPRALSYLVDQCFHRISHGRFTGCLQNSTTNLPTGYFMH